MEGTLPRVVNLFWVSTPLLQDRERKRGPCIYAALIWVELERAVHMLAMERAFDKAWRAESTS